MAKKIFITFLLLALFSISVSPALAGVWHGRYNVDCNESDKGPCTFCDMVKVAANVVQMLVELTFAIGALAIVIGAGMMILSAGSEERYAQGRKIITNTIIGIFVAAASWLIVNTIFHLMTGNPNFPWNEIAC